MPDRIKMRVINRYRGAEADQFGGTGVPEGAVIYVTPERARQLIADGNAAPIAGPSETKDALGNAAGATVGEAAPSASLQADQASQPTTVTKRPVGRPRKAGKS